MNLYEVEQELECLLWIMDETPNTEIDKIVEIILKINKVKDKREFLLFKLTQTFNTQT